jgi:hypothetical protein
MGAAPNPDMQLEPAVAGAKARARMRPPAV